MTQWSKEAQERKQKKKKKAPGDKAKKPSATAGNDAAGDVAGDKKKALQPRQPPEEIEAYFEAPKGLFWSPNGREQWQQFTTDSMSNMLECRGYSAKCFDGETVSQVRRFLHEIRYWKSIDWAGELGGWKTGWYEVAGLQMLIFRGRIPVVAKKGDYPLCRAFFKTLLGPKQLPYFLGWLKGALTALESGCPFRPGQLVAFAGSPNCGKSFAQILITEILGGRAGDPTDFLSNETKFTADFLRAEHLAVEDKALKDFSQAKRRLFAANLKTLVANMYQKVHPKNKEAILLPVGTRLTLSVNDAPEALAILPALDSDVQDKMIYFLCKDGELPARKDRAVTLEQQFNAFKAELPALVYYLQRWKIPEKILDPGNRFAVAAYHHPEIIERLQHLTPEQRLLNLLQILPVKWPADGVFTGTGHDIEQWMRSVDDARLVDRLLSFNNSMGYLLSKIAKDGEERVTLFGTKGSLKIYKIYQSEL